MNQQIVGRPDGVHLYVERLGPGTVPLAARLCDECVGKNLYPPAYLREICGRPKHYFYLLRTPEGEAMGYYYFHLTDLAGMAAFTRLPLTDLTGLCPKRDPVTANLRSIGILPEHRRKDLSIDLVRYFLDMLANRLHADLAFCVCWKPKGKIPVNHSLDAFHFVHLTDVPRFWEDVPDLDCPYCEGRCRCDAAVYYIQLKGGEQP